MNLTAILILVLMQPAQAAFTRFTYCREMPRGLYEKQCLVLAPDGNGEGQLKRRGSDVVQVPFTLSAPGREKFLAVIAATNNLADGKNYETKKKVADLGRKQLTLEMPAGTRDAVYNYSDLKEVNALSAFFDGLLNQQTLSLDLETAVRFERLSVPQRLDQLDDELKASRIGDPEGLIPLMEKLARDERLLEYARQHAEQIKNRLSMPIKGK
jgi:hypothetical protein